MSAPTSAAVFGSTGLTGSNILISLLAAESKWKPVHTISRRAPKSSGTNLDAIIEADTAKWASTLSKVSPTPTVVFSAIGTTRGAAGGIQQQWKIDHDLNIEIAKAAKEAGAKTFVFISSAGTRGIGSSHIPYSQMKVGVEDKIKELDFDNAIILRPGTILGDREESRMAEGIFQKLIFGLGKISPAAKNALGQEVSYIGRAAVKAAQQASEGNAPSKYWVVESSDILKLGEPEKPAAAE